MRYVIQFSKQGNMRYISHLDLLRLFKRSFKRVGIKLLHSQGFNPHPKMSFVQPLSLGYTSTSEYLEVETMEGFTDEEIVSRLCQAMPPGIGILSCHSLPATKRTLAAMVEFGRYHLAYSLEGSDTEAGNGQWTTQLIAFLKQDEIIVSKKQKKTKKMVDQDIRSMIYSAEPESGEVDCKNIMLVIMVRAGSNCNLNPEVFFRAFCEFASIPFNKELLRVEREDLYCLNQVDNSFVAIRDYSFDEEQKLF